LSTEQGLLAFVGTRLNSSAKNYFHNNFNSPNRIPGKNGVKLSHSARIFGKVLFGQNVTVGENTIILGPSIISSNAKIATGAVVRGSIIGPGVSVPRNKLILNRIIIEQKERQKQAGQIKTTRLATGTNGDAFCENHRPNNFRTWPRLSYAGCFKRVADMVMAAIVLILFAPVLPIIALVIKLTCRGPVLFKDKRQGLHGKAFYCLKFRTMLVGSDKIQEKLRALNQADGPQFKITDDPRLSTVGRFLRDTYIDEVPQFFNVLVGQMSVVGPRPSPESENTLCPPWRDARLSIRPGITGLWQTCRTRQSMKDFQEWIYYDTKYVAELSLKTDLWICFQTARKMLKTFVSMF